MNPTLIIDRPHLVPHHRRLIYGVTTLAIWYFWLYLWLPLVTFFGWLTGGMLGYEQMVVLDGYRSLAHLLAWYGVVILILDGGLIVWATYNLLRFRGKERRSELPNAEVGAYAEHFGMAAHELSAWRKAKVLNVHHDTLGRVERVTVAPAPNTHT
jgi:biofilm PGA synthesis protein PgaD